MADLNDLSKRLNAIARTIGHVVGEAQMAYGAELTKSLIDETPVQTGNLRGNWHLNPDGIPPPYEFKKTGSAHAAYMQALSELHTRKPTKNINISNTAPYLLRRMTFDQINRAANRGKKRAEKKSQEVFNSAAQNFGQMLDQYGGY